MSARVDPNRDRANVSFYQVGKPLVRTDAPGKAVGRTPYAGDYVMPGMLHAKVLRSPMPSAKLVRLDVRKARALKGVVAVITARELPDRLAATDIPGQTGQTRLKTDQQILVRERVRYHGEPLALIAAESPDIAEQAMSLIEYKLEPWPAVFDPHGRGQTIKAARWNFSISAGGTPVSTSRSLPLISSRPNPCPHRSCWRSPSRSNPPREGPRRISRTNAPPSPQFVAFRPFHG